MTKYGDTLHKRIGIQRQSVIIKKTVEQLKQAGFKVHSLGANLKEDMNDKIDVFLQFDESTPFHGKTKVAVDVKWNRTLTVLNKNNEDTLLASKSDYLVFEVNENLHWFKKEDVKDWVYKNSHRIKDNKQGDGSKWICVVGSCPHELNL